VLASLLLKQIFLYDVGYDVQHPGTVQWALFMWLDLHTLYQFKESTPLFLLVKLRVFNKESDGLLFPKVVLTI